MSVLNCEVRVKLFNTLLEVSLVVPPSEKPNWASRVALGRTIGDIALTEGDIAPTEELRCEISQIVRAAEGRVCASS